MPIHEILEKENTYIGTDFAGYYMTLAHKERMRHLYVIGKTGTGKSTLLHNMLAQDLSNGLGIALIDPHGDLAQDVLSLLPTHRADHLVYIDPTDLSRPVGFNPLAHVPITQRPLVADGIVSAFQHIWPDSWGPRLEAILINAIRALLDAEGTTLLCLPRLLTDASYRDLILSKCKDPMVKNFFTSQFNVWDNRFRNDAIAPVLNKVGRVLIDPTIRNMLAQTKSTFDIRRMMDEGRVLIVNLSKGAIGEGTAHLLGALLTTSIAQAALSRRDIVEKNRRPFHLYVDEFQNFSTNSFGTILSEARKYGLSLTLSHQYLQQLPEDLQAAVLGNAGSLISYRIGAQDSELVGHQLGHTNPSTLSETRNFSGWCSLMSEGIPSQAWPFDGFAPIHPLHNRADRLIKNSRIRFGRPLAPIEKMIKQVFAPHDFLSINSQNRIKIQNRD